MFFHENKVDYLLVATVLTKEHQKQFSKLNVPIVILGQYTENYTCIYHDDYGASKALTSSLYTPSSRWGYLSVRQSDEAVGKQRLKGFLDALSAQDSSISEDYIVESQFDIDSGYHAAKTLLDAHPEINTLICATDTIAAGAFQYISEIKRSIPADIRLAGFGDSSLSRIMTPSLTTVHFHYKTAGIEATRLLLEMMKEPKHILKKQLKLGYTIVHNDSTKL